MYKYKVTIVFYAANQHVRSVWIGFADTAEIAKSAALAESLWGGTVTGCVVID